MMCERGYVNFHLVGKQIECLTENCGDAAACETRFETPVSPSQELE